MGWVNNHTARLRVLGLERVFWDARYSKATTVAQKDKHWENDKKVVAQVGIT